MNAKVLIVGAIVFALLWALLYYVVNNRPLPEEYQPSQNSIGVTQ